MPLPADFPYENDLGVITIKTEFRASTTASTSPADYYTYQYVLVPIYYWVIFATLIIFLFQRIIIDFIIRWRQKH